MTTAKAKLATLANFIEGPMDDRTRPEIMVWLFALTIADDDMASELDVGTVAEATGLDRRTVVRARDRLLQAK